MKNMDELPGNIRPVTEQDAAQLLDIYRPYIEENTVSFELTVPSIEEFKSRIKEYVSYAPWIVWEINGEVGGYAYGSKHRTRAAYQWALEVSVYVASRYHRQGVARILYSQLLDDLARRGFYLALAGITLPNDASIGFHESMGFEPVGVYRNIGYKFGQWHDVGWWQKQLKSPQETPG